MKVKKTNKSGQTRLQTSGEQHDQTHSGNISLFKIIVQIYFIGLLNKQQLFHGCVSEKAHKERK